jgi:hypothetical protein
LDDWLTKVPEGAFQRRGAGFAKTLTVSGSGLCETCLDKNLSIRELGGQDAHPTRIAAYLGY